MKRGKEMEKRKFIRDYGIKVGSLKPGLTNSITDVEGVKVGHTTLKEGRAKTGVTAILPHQDNIFQNKVNAASYVINGFGKTLGTIQIDELGTIETPIILTNTLSIGTAAEALIEYSLSHNDEIGRTTGTVNPVICECNDMFLNDIRALHVKKEHVFSALANAESHFEQGAVGAGTGMRCYGLKGGIGSSSRLMTFEHGVYTMGVLVMSNFGQMKDLTINGDRTGKKIETITNTNHKDKDKGSIIFIVATDLPVSNRQLKRIIKRTTVGLSRTGSYIGHGSGDIAIGFSTAQTIPHGKTDGDLLSNLAIHEEEIDLAFRAVAEATEEAILNSMTQAETTIGRDGNKLESLNEYLGQLVSDKLN